MPEITRFRGIVIKIFFRNEHNPPHIHAIHGDFNGLIEISSMNMFEGDLSPKDQELVAKWGSAYIKDLQDMWDNKNVRPLPPLED